MFRSCSLAALALAVAAPSALGAAAPERVTFPSSGTQLVGYHFAPDAGASASAPVVVIAHGLGGLQSSRLRPFAERFADAGYHALTFDYRSWGESAGTPRNVIDANRQQDDYRAAVSYARTFPGVDGRVVLWGTSLSGGHVLSLGAKMPELAGVMAQAPHVSGPATVGALPLGSLPALTAAGVEDAARAAVGKSPRYIPLSAQPGGFGALSQAGAADGYAFVQPTSPAPGNVMAARFVLQLPFYSPDTTAARSKVPTYIGVGETDNVTPPKPAIALANKMGATLRRYPGGHFSVYPGAENYEAVVSDQLAFLKANVPVQSAAR